jgi:hypothetical protein
MTTIRIAVYSIVFIVLFGCKNKPTTHFKKISSSHSGIEFNNEIIETDSINIMDFSNVYNGGGVGIADFNNDGLQDIYFTGNIVENKLYLNKGDLKFADVTKESGTQGEGKWSRGVAIVDINNDKRPDIYISATINPDPAKRKNILYINTGNDDKGIPQFNNMAEEYGLADTTHTTQAAFFDYDNDGDLDVYLCVNEVLAELYPNQFRPVMKDGTFPSTGRLYRNEWDSTANHPVFKNVSKEAGVTIEGYGHHVSISDINLDGWKDIYVTNDYLSSNILYINNQDGTFTDKIFSYLKHSAANAMGADIIDINNDGLSDIIELDMNPEDNYRKKMMLMPVTYLTYQNSDRFGYHYQYVRNTLQLNMGNRVLANDSAGDPVFSEIGFYSDITETDWSWAPLVADFDNDTYRDMIVTNGFPKDITDHDFAAFREESGMIATKEQLLEQIPEVKLHNYFFRNNGNLKFSNETEDWGMSEPTFSNGAVYADLDNDGDLDVVISNINDKALLYENTLQDKKRNDKNYLQVKFEGNAPNTDALGTWIKLFYKNKQQAYEHYTVRGYLSSVSCIAHFGLDSFTSVDSIKIIWPDHKSQTLYNVTANQVLTLKQADAKDLFDWKNNNYTSALLTDITNTTGISYTQNEIDYIDFNVQKLLPHKLSEYGPALAAGDLNGDGIDDLVVGGSYGISTKLFLQKSNSLFDSVDLVPNASRLTKQSEDMGIVLFDADNDGDNDLYITSGGYENPAYTFHYRDKFYLNDGKAHFTLDTTVFPVNYTSKSCVKACDYDKDGDMDLFIGGRVHPWKYPKPVSSFIYRNDSKEGKIKFTDVSAEIAPMLNDLGLVCDALWTDFDNDGWTDLVLAGEWMPLKFLKNENGKLKDISASTGINDKTGWWNSITSGDFDNDGDMDYIAGNLGENSFLEASDQYPVSVYAKDFNNNGQTWQCIPTKFIIDRDGKRKEFPVDGRDDVVDQMPFIKKGFLTYKQFATATIDKLFTPEQMKGAIKYSATWFSNSLIRNNGNGKFSIEALPQAAQLSCVMGIVVEDLDGDGHLDVCLNSNDFSTIPSLGRYDAMNGLVLKGNGNGTFTALSIQQSGVFIPGNGRAFCMLSTANNSALFAASQNRGQLKIYGLRNSLPVVVVPQNAIAAELLLSNNKKRKVEFSTGSSFLSQSSKRLLKTNAIKEIKWIYDITGKKDVAKQ